MKNALLLAAALGTLPAALSFAVDAQAHAVESPVAPAELTIAATLPVAALDTVPSGHASLLPGLFHQRRELAKNYVERLDTDRLLLNHRMEAGIGVNVPVESMFLGWEAPTSQLRGHFAGHWLSAAAHFAANDRDEVLAARVREVVRELGKCQKANGDGWVGSVPEKYFAILESDRWIWSPQYTLHKTMMGLDDAYAFCSNREALDIDSASADWFLDWTGSLLAKGRGDVIYGGECAGMLELWANLYGETGDRRYLTLASRYGNPDIFSKLLAGEDPLSNNHANATIPWIEGAARLYEVTGDVRYRHVVEAFWKDAVEERGMLATTGNNAGEFWIPKQQFGRFLGPRTQEHCTAYNMLRVAQFLFRWTGDARYASYIERALYNGILAQQNPNTGMVAYFLPTGPGGKKVWGSETHDFWCCDGTMIQAQALFEDLIYYTHADAVTVSQFIASELTLGDADNSVHIVQNVDMSGAPESFSQAGDVTSITVDLDISSDRKGPWTLRLRQPEWALGTGLVTIDGEAVTPALSGDGFLEITREWKKSHLVVRFAKRLTREPLPGDPTRFAFLDGPVVLAALCGEEPELAGDGAIVPQYEHLYEEGRNWQSGHYLARTSRGSVLLKPLHEVADEAYCIYFVQAK